MADKETKVVSVATSPLSSPKKHPIKGNFEKSGKIYKINPATGEVLKDAKDQPISVDFKVVAVAFLALYQKANQYNNADGSDFASQTRVDLAQPGIVFECYMNGVKALPLHFSHYTGGDHIARIGGNGQLQNLFDRGFPRGGVGMRSATPAISYHNGFNQQYANIVLECAADVLDSEEGVEFRAYLVTPQAIEEVTAARREFPGFSRILAVTSDGDATARRAQGSDANYKQIAAERKADRLAGIAPSNAAGSYRDSGIRF